MIIITILESYIVHLSSSNVLKAFENTLSERFCSLWIMRPKGLQGAAAHSAATARNTRASPFSWTWFFYVRYTTHETYGFTSHPKGEALTVRKALL